MNGEPLQTDEVVKALTERQECTLVHQGTGVEVDVYTDICNPKEPWCIRYSHYEILDREVLRQALLLGFRLHAAYVDDQYTRYELSRNCLGIRAAAIKALSLARMLPGVPRNAWLWVTVYQHDDRNEPPSPPTPWPPIGR